MKVLQHTSARLVIQERLLGIWLLSLASILTGIFMFFLFEPPVDCVGVFCMALGGIFCALTPTETFVFDKQDGYLKVHQKRLLNQKINHHDLSDIVMVQVHTVDFWGTRFYRVSLQLTSDAEVTVTRTISTDWQQQQKMVRHIRGFLDNVHRSNGHQGNGVLLPTNPG
jgi:hypothetical protein